MVDAVREGEKMFEYRVMHDHTLTYVSACYVLFLYVVSCLVEQFRYPSFLCLEIIPINTALTLRYQNSFRSTQMTMVVTLYSNKKCLFFASTRQRVSCASVKAANSRRSCG